MKKPISNLKVYDLDESLIASGYPMRANLVDREPDEKDLKRVLNLVGASASNAAHAQCTTGMLVSFDLTFTNKAWVEAERYKFLNFVSSQSTMHCITKFSLENQYIEYVDPIMIERMQEKIDEYNNLLKVSTENRDNELLKEKYLEILYSNPAGFYLTARVTTNYRSLLNIYIQRKNHRLPEWRLFCKQLLNELPLFKEFVAKYEGAKGETIENT